MTRPTFTITLQYVGTGSATNALKWALKFLWRCADLKCVNITEVEHDQPPEVEREPGVRQ